MPTAISAAWSNDNSGDKIKPETDMKRIIILVFALLLPQLIQAQGTYLSNLGQPSAGNLAVGSNRWFAAGFVTGSNVGGYKLDSVELKMANANFNPNGFTVMLYTNSLEPAGSTFIPGNSLGTLNGSANPATSGIYAYNSGSNITLSSSTAYYLVLTAGTPIPFAYLWSFVGSGSYNPSDGWNAGGGLYSSTTGSSWTSFGSYFPQFAINATAVPEPGMFHLVGLGGLAFLWHRRKAGAVL